jgi:hypothetical protein
MLAACSTDETRIFKKMKDLKRLIDDRSKDIG